MQTGGAAEPVWYIQDEVGSVIQHSDEPNVKVMTFFHSPGKAINDPN